MSSILPEAAPVDGGLLGKVQYWFACFFTVGWTGVVCGGLYYQFVEWEYPCPLCIVQRMFMLLAAIGSGVIVRRGIGGLIGGRDYMMGWGLALVAVIGGSFCSWRQTMLHILPGDKGYGSEVFGLHLYVWAWILFQASVVAIGLVMALAHSTSDRSVPQDGPYRAVGQVALGFLGLVIAVNLVAVFFEEGFHWFLPDDPVRYQLPYDLGILG
ncbi:disulfide bond formation protein B [Streptomyces sp. NPDC089919]|uniref:disulfide bond formation protein B n=1 Tax=Streptomyces sp. NPDC089919 TaxID=3155188 RepID=UPI00341847F2